jgi:hypothetical protein
MRGRSARPLVLLALLVPGLACSPQIDLAASVSLTDVQSGYVDAGPAANGWNHLLPNLTFRLKNVSDRDISNVQLLVNFRAEGAEVDIASAQVSGIGPDGLGPGAETDPVVVRPDTGFTLEGPLADFFVHSGFVDVTARVFARRAGKVVPVGEFKMDRRIIPQQSTSGGR